MPRGARLCFGPCVGLVDRIWLGGVRVIPFQWSLEHQLVSDIRRAVPLESGPARLCLFVPGALLW